MTHLSRPSISWFAMLACFLGFAFAATTHAAPTEILGPGDSLRITVFQNPELTTEARVSSQGEVQMPLIGSVQLHGLTTKEASNLIARRFMESNILKDPEILVSLIQVRSRMVSVLGQVARPGRYPLEEPNNQLIELLALAGGVINDGDDTLTVTGLRDNAPMKITVNISTLLAGVDPRANIPLENGDTIFVRRAPVFYIYGEVQRPGAYRLVDNLNVMQAMSLGGGITRRGTERGIRIHRPSADGMLVKMEAKPSEKVQADDVIYVNESLF